MQIEWGNKRNTKREQGHSKTVIWRNKNNTIKDLSINLATTPILQHFFNNIINKSKNTNKKEL